MKKICMACLIILLFASLALGLPGTVKYRLVWDANTESDLAGYKGYWSTATATYNDTDSLNVGNVTECPLENLLLVDQTKYYFVVTAYDTSNNESDFSKEVSHFFDKMAPAAPGGVDIKLIIEIR